MLTLYCLLKETASKTKFQLLFSFALFRILPCPYMKKKNHYPHTNKYLTHDNLHLLACFVFVCLPAKRSIAIPIKHLSSNYANEIFNPL